MLRPARQMILGFLALAALGASPAAAATLVRFSFTADGTPVAGTMTLDCPPGAGTCSILALEGTFGDTRISRDPDPPPPIPTPPPPIPPDNQVKRPEYSPSVPGADFWNVTIYFRFSADPDEDDRIWRLMAFESGPVEFVREYTVTDYHAEVPEPAVWALMLTGFFGAGAAIRQRRREPAGSAVLG